MTRVIDRDNGVQKSYLDLKNAKSATAWIVPSVAKCQAEKKEDRINTDDTVQDLQVTISFSVCVGDAIIKFRSLISPRNLINTPYKDMRWPIEKYVSPKDSSNGRKG